MKARLWLAEAGTTHPDHTLSVLRAGIDLLQGGSLPVLFRGVLAVRFDASMVDKGDHRYDIGCMDEDGRDMMPRAAGPLPTPAGGRAYHYLVRLTLALPRYGRYVFFARVDSVELDTWAIRVLPGPPEGALE